MKKKTVQCIQQIAKLGTLNIIKHHSTMINRRMDILGMGFPKFETIPVERIPWRRTVGSLSPQHPSPGDIGQVSSNNNHG
jgi:hypothetical protein